MGRRNITAQVIENGTFKPLRIVEGPESKSLPALEVYRIEADGREMYIGRLADQPREHLVEIIRSWRIFYPKNSLRPLY